MSKYTQTYICQDCVMVFQFYQKPKRGKLTPYCPNCGDNVSTVKYSSVKKEGDPHIQISYRPEEDEIVKQITEGKLTRGQAAFLLGRTAGSVRMRQLRLEGKVK